MRPGGCRVGVDDPDRTWSGPATPDLHPPATPMPDRISRPRGSVDHRASWSGDALVAGLCTRLARPKLHAKAGLAEAGSISLLARVLPTRGRNAASGDPGHADDPIATSIWALKSVCRTVSRNVHRAALWSTVFQGISLRESVTHVSPPCLPTRGVDHGSASFAWPSEPRGDPCHADPGCRSLVLSLRGAANAGNEAIQLDGPRRRGGAGSPRRPDQSGLLAMTF
jgi:hypothetical protein